MGLDHGLYRKIYVKNWEHSKTRYEVTVCKNGKLDSSIKPGAISYVNEEIITWRKANQIHNWFVHHVQNGEDDCQDYFVSAEEVRQLIGDCEKVLQDCKLVPGKVWAGTAHKDGKTEELYEEGLVVEDDSTAKSILPTSSGFFFGSTQYDEWYVQDLQRSVDALKEALDRDVDADFTYWSSW